MSSQTNPLTKADSLKTALTNVKDACPEPCLGDTTRINLLNKLGWELMYNNPDTSILLSKQALSILTDIAIPNTRGWQSPSMLYPIIQKLIANSNSNLGVYYWLKGDYPLSLSYQFKALKIRKQFNEQKGIATSLGNIGIVYDEQGDYPNALKYYFEALEIAKELGDKNGMASHIGNIGIVYKEQGDYPKALKYYFEALEIGKELRNKRGIATCLNNIGLVYWNQGDFHSSLKYYFEALEIDKEIGNKNGKARRFGNIGIIYYEQATAAKSRQDIAKSDTLYANALKYYFDALEIAKELGNKNGVARHLGNISIVYKEQADAAKSRQDIAGSDSLYAKALKHYFESLEIDKELVNKSGMARQLGNIGLLYTEKCRFKEAEAYLDSALAIDLEIGTILGQMHRYQALSQLYDSTGNWQLAYQHYKKYSVAKDSLFNEEKSKDIGRLEQKHEFELAEIERTQKELERSRQEAAAVGRRNLLQYSGIILGLAVLFIAIFLFARRFRKIKEEKTHKKYVKIIEATLFISFFIFFEFILVLLDPYLEKLTGGQPAYKLLVNAILAGVIFPLHSFLEAKLKASVIKSKDVSHKPGDSGYKTLLLLVGLAFISLVNISLSDNSDSLIHNLKFKIQNCKEDTAKIKLLNALGWELMYQNPDTSVLLGKKALELAEHLPSPKGELVPISREGLGVRSKLIAHSNNNLGVYYWLKGEYPLSLSYHLKALEIREQLNDKKDIAASLGNIGLVYWNQGDNPNALKHYFDALEIAKELGDKKGMAKRLGNIGLVYHDQLKAANTRQDITGSNSLYTNTLKYYFEALEIDKELGNKNGMAIHLGNIGNVYNLQADAAKSPDMNRGSDSLYDKAMKHYFEALEIDKELGNKNGMARHLGNIGTVYFEQANAAKTRQDIAGSDTLYAKALKHYFEALEIAKELEYKKGIAIRLGNIGLLYIQKGRFKEAEAYLDSALVIDLEIGRTSGQMHRYKALSELYDTTSRYQLAYHHYKKYSAAKDSLFNEEKSKDIGRLEQKHQFEMAELEREQKEEEKSRQGAAAVGRRNLLQYSSIFLVLFFLFGVVFFLGRIPIAEWLVELSTFVPFMILFEFILVLIDPYMEKYIAEISGQAGGEPLYKLLINAGCAMILFPIHSFLEKKLKARIFKIKR